MTDVKCCLHDQDIPDPRVAIELEAVIAHQLQQIAGVEAQSFKDAGRFSWDRGLVVTWRDGSEFTVTIHRSISSLFQLQPACRLHAGE